MRWMVYGAGAVGGVLGGLLHEAGPTSCWWRAARTSTRSAATG